MAEKSQLVWLRVRYQTTGTSTLTAWPLTMIKKSLPISFHRLAKPIG